jgi:magnesium transporter
MVGAQRNEAPRASVGDDGRPTALLFEGERAERLGDFDDLPTRLGGSKLLWIDIPGPSEDALRSVGAQLELDEEALRSLASTAPGPAFRDAGAFVHLTIHSPGGNGSDEVTEVECLIADNWVVTAHDRPVGVLDDFAELASGSGATGELDGPSFAAALLGWVINEYSTAFDRLEEELDDVDERAMRGRRPPEEEIEQLVALRKRAARLRRSLVAHRPLLLALTHPELEDPGDSSSARRFHALLARHEATVQSARDVRESIFGSFDVLIARTGHRTNEIMKILTLASVVLLPGALVAGVMGMNFKVGLFEHPSVFWFVVAGIVTVGAATLATAKLRGWL